MGPRGPTVQDRMSVFRDLNTPSSEKLKFDYSKASVHRVIVTRTGA